jgi:serine/threonine protein kinase/predicted ATPase
VTHPARGDVVTPSIRLIEPLGEGGMGSVWLAFHEALRTEVVVKFIVAALAGDPEARARFSREAAAAAQVKSPHVVHMLDHGVTERGLPFIVMERLEGHDLAHELELRRRLAPDAVVAIVTQLARALVRAHDAGIVHRDIKPSNVFLCDAGDGALFVKLLDFGVAKASATLAFGDDTRSGRVVGTPYTMSPEQIVGSPDVDFKSDLWALGVVTLEALTGNRPFSAETIGALTLQVHQAPLPRPTTLDPSLPAALDTWFAKACARSRADRFESAKSMAEALSEALRDHTATPRVAPTFTPGRARSGIEFELAATGIAERAALPTTAHLPSESNGFFGRDEALRALSRHFDEGARLVTLLGLGGAGKTRLAAHFGWQSLRTWVGGVWFCDLSEARSKEGVAIAVARTLDVPLGKSDPVDQLGHALARRGRCLLVLDNVEQVVHEASEAVSTWLERAPDTRTLVTSRERLGLDVERVLPLDSLAEDDAIALFIARAEAAKPGFSNDEVGRGTLALLVRVLDSLPLAIELAAARVRVLAPTEILGRMTERFKLLATAGVRGGRQATLRGTLDWSWELLSQDERRALAGLAVFEGGFTMEAAEEVLDLDELWPVDAVQSLVEKSLLRRTGEARFGFFASVHDYASEKLHASGRRLHAEARHGAYYARLGGDEALRALNTHGGIARRRALTIELDNVRTASERAASRGDAETAGRTALAAWAIIDDRGPYDLGATLLETALAISSSSDLLGCWLHLRLCEAHRHSLRRADEAVARFDAVISMFRDLGDHRALASALAGSSWTCVVRGDHADALARFSEALTLSHATGDVGTECVALANMAWIELEQGHFDEASRSLELALTRCRDHGDRRTEGAVLSHRGVLAFLEGRLKDASEVWELALDVAREQNTRRLEGVVLTNLGEAQRTLADLTAARATFEAAHRVHRDLGDPRVANVTLGELAAVDHAEGARPTALARFDEAETGLRSAEDRYQLCLLLASRAALEARYDRAAARRDFTEALGLATAIGAAPESELMQRIRKAKAGLGQD